tara:strand:+ start:1109 stop:1354 length:246 start_codon:yes stop_codon:yes gene_type:complete
LNAATAIKQSATLKRQETKKRIVSNKNKLAELNAKKVGEMVNREEIVRKQREAGLIHGLDVDTIPFLKSISSHAGGLKVIY